MIGTLSTVIDSEDQAMRLWTHEVVRVLSDRLIDSKDKEWFDSEVENRVGDRLGKRYVEMVKKQSLFVDFMRDAPEPTGEEGEDADVELPKVYEPIEDMNVLKERVVMFLSQYNEIVRGSPMNLVFFPDAMITLVKISRIIRSPSGNSLLVGVGGSGKQSLTKLSSFIAGYKTFQISLTRSIYKLFLNTFSYNNADMKKKFKVLQFEQLFGGFENIVPNMWSSREGNYIYILRPRHQRRSFSGVFEQRSFLWIHFQFI